MSHHTNISAEDETKTIQAQMLAVATFVDDGGDARRAPKGVSLAVFNQFLKALETKKTPRVGS